MTTEIQANLDKALHHLEWEFWKLQMGRANPSIVEDIMVEQYGSLWPIKNCASINVLDPQTLSISPWDKTLIHIIAKAITDAGVGLNPQSQAESVLIRVPQLTEERRIEMTKVVKKFWEDAKVSVRNIRSEFHKKIKKMETEKELSEDQARDMESDIQKYIDEANKKIDEATKRKEADIMKV